MLKIIGKIFVLLIISTIGIIGYARFIEPNLLIVKSYSVEIEQPIKACRVVFFTDTHFGKFYNETHAAKITDKINDLDPDLVIFGGDLLDHYARDRENLDFAYLSGELNRIEASIGKFAVWGNHDYGGGAVRMYEQFMTSCGFEILQNDSRVFEQYGIKLIGYDDYLMGWTDPLLYKTQSDFFQIIVAHEPIISQYIDNKSENFMFSGHTHGGQVSVPYLTAKVLPEGSEQFLKGFYSKKQIGTDTSINMYTSSGIGMTKYPLRLCNMPEIIMVDFQYKE